MISQVLAIPPKRRDRAHRQLPHRRGDRRAARRPRPHHLARPPRPRPAPARRPDRAAGLRAHRPDRQDVHLGAGPHVRCHGKGRKDRATPLTAQTVAVLRTWLAELGRPARRPAVPHPARRPALPRRRRAPRRQARRPPPRPPARRIKEKHVTPHTLRHTAAMTLLHAGVDTSVIALWLGHEEPRPPRSTCTPT